MKLTTALVFGAQAIAALVSAESVAVTDTILAAPAVVKAELVRPAVLPAVLPTKDVSGKPKLPSFGKDVSGKPKLPSFGKAVSGKPSRFAFSGKAVSGKPSRFAAWLENFYRSNTGKPFERKSKDTSGKPKVQLTREARPAFQKKERKEKDNTGEPKVLLTKDIKLTKEARPTLEKKERKEKDTTGEPKVTRAHRKHNHVHKAGTGKPQVKPLVQPKEGAEKVEKKIKPLVQPLENAEKVKPQVQILEGADKIEKKVIKKE